MSNSNYTYYTSQLSESPVPVKRKRSGVLLDRKSWLQINRARSNTDPQKDWEYRNWLTKLHQKAQTK